MRVIPTTICWGIGVWIVAAQAQVGPPVTKDPPVPISSTGNVVPVTPPLPYKPKWNLTLPEATGVKVAAGKNEFFVGTDAGTLTAYALADARQVWSKSIGANGVAAGDGLVFVADGRVVRALNQATGDEVWSIATGPLATPPKWLPGWLFTQAVDGTVAAWRISDAGKIWEQKLSAPASAPPALDGDLLFVPLQDRRLVCLNITEGIIQWNLELDGQPIDPTAAAGRVYFGTSNYTFYSVKQENGELEWPPHRMIRAMLIGHPILDERYIWITTLNNKVHALSRGNGQMEITNGLTARPTEQFIIDGGQVIVPLASGELAIFNQKDGTPMPSPTSPLTAAAAAAAAAAATPPAAVPGAPAAVAPAMPPGVTVAVPGRPAPGTSMTSPLLSAGLPDAPIILRTTLNAGSGHVVTSFEREKPPVPGADQPSALPTP